MLVSILLWLVGGLIVVVVVATGYMVMSTRRIAADAERQVPPVGKFVEIDGNRIHYVDAGEGPPVVFLHGLGAQLHHFLHPLFGRFGTGYRLIALDRPGSGYSVRADGATGRLPEQAEVVRRFIETLGLEKPLVVGHSLGGAIALTLAVEHPEAISGIALLAPLTHMERRIRGLFKAIYIPSTVLRMILANTIAIPMSLKYAGPTLDLVFSPQSPPADYGTAGGGWLGLRPSHFYATSTDLVAIEHDLGHVEQRYKEITMPAGILFGTSDRVLNIGVHGRQMIEKIKDLDFESINGLGHMPQFVEPDRIIAFVRRIADRAFADRRSTLPHDNFTEPSG